MQLGKKQSLTVVKMVDFGIYLADPEKEIYRCRYCETRYKGR